MSATSIIVNQKGSSFAAATNVSAFAHVFAAPLVLVLCRGLGLGLGLEFPPNGRCAELEVAS